MSEQFPGIPEYGEYEPSADLPRILESTQDNEGNIVIDIAGQRAMDVFATIEYHEPDEVEFYAFIEDLFDLAVDAGMLNNFRMEITGQDEDLGDNIEFERYISFLDDISAQQAHLALLAITNDDTMAVFEIKKLTIGAFMDAGEFPLAYLILDSNNELNGHDPDKLAAEMADLTDKFKNGVDLGGPTVTITPIRSEDAPDDEAE
jgi:hypothetical protein